MAVVGLYRVDKQSRVITSLCKTKVRNHWIHFLQNVVAVDAPKVIVARYTVRSPTCFRAIGCMACACTKAAMIG
jgi:hypothetical protein